MADCWRARHRSRRDRWRFLDRVNDLQAENAAAQAEVESIRKKFAKHDMNVLSLRKPGLIENIINRGTKEVLSDLETLTNPSP
mgnify:CR=1 FL=1